MKEAVPLVMVSVWGVHELSRRILEDSVTRLELPYNGLRLELRGSFHQSTTKTRKDQLYNNSSNKRSWKANLLNAFMLLHWAKPGFHSARDFVHGIL